MSWTIEIKGIHIKCKVVAMIVEGISKLKVLTLLTLHCVCRVKRSSAAQTTEFRFLLMHVWSCLDVWWVKKKTKHRNQTENWHLPSTYTLALFNSVPFKYAKWLCFEKGITTLSKNKFKHSLINIFGHELLLFRDRRETTAPPPSYKVPLSRSLFLHFSKSFSVRSYRTTVPHKHMNKKLFDNMHQWV